MTAPANSTHTFTLADEMATRTLAERCANHFPQPCLVALLGTLGAGKTSFARAFAAACGIDPKEVTSPTFTLWQTYHGKRLIHHLDAYRLSDEDEFDALGVHEAFAEQATVLIEWADRVAGSLPPERLELTLGVRDREQRQVTLNAYGSRNVDAAEQIARYYAK